ncbi:alpha/beta hydrolase [Persicimonas caeni]|uniref:Alpha/beta hydrolase n=1 Tax=Persicimonas caeni TaxID=2292766 RepID=A0A4Y6Q083_PERCE|nr:alpha/beta fold hydrolase [Persicimonas caeni]QDG53932.1 alpha/beta hydrolase [Persicimonas caeni]QED35153.1 lysophospholipase [Persicimonas caeni]
MSIANHDIISQRYFFPQRHPLPGAKMVDVGEAKLACDAHDAGHDLTLVHFHGNGEIVGHYVPGFAETLADLGVNSFFAEYRGYGGSTGVPRLGAMLEDVSAIRDAVGKPDDKLVVFGRSIGSIYAIEFAARYPDIAGLVLESGIADVLERILLRASPSELGSSLEAMQEEFGRLFDHEQKLGQYTGPTLVLHTEHDHLVDKTHAERNAAWAGGDAELVMFERGDHNSIYGANRHAYLQALRAFFEMVA